jgi:hypothetical protein
VIIANILRFCLIPALVSLELVPFAWVAQAGTTGALLGYVTNTDDVPIAGADISAVAPSGRATTVTGATGFYSLNGLPLDTYTVTFSKDGYATRAVSDITTIRDQSIRVNVRLEPIKTLARVSVRSSTSQVQPAVTADTYVVSQTRLSDINGTPQDKTNTACSRR